MSVHLALALVLAGGDVRDEDDLSGTCVTTGGHLVPDHEPAAEEGEEVGEAESGV